MNGRLQKLSLVVAVAGIYSFFGKKENIKLFELPPMKVSPTPEFKFQILHTLKCLSFGTPKTINCPFVPNGKLIGFRCFNI